MRKMKHFISSDGIEKKMKDKNHRIKFINFNGISTCLRLFYTKILSICV